MARTKKVKEIVEKEMSILQEEVANDHVIIYAKTLITPLTQEFGNGDMNVLRDKINEIIKAI